MAKSPKAPEKLKIPTISKKVKSPVITTFMIYMKYARNHSIAYHISKKQS